MSGKVLITGASGFVGYHLILAAQRAGLTVSAAVRSSSDTRHLQALNVALIHLDYNSVADLEKRLKGYAFDYIIHAAGITKANEAAVYNKVNADYARNLALAAQSAGVKKIVYLSSLAALGPLDGPDEDPMSEDKIPAPVTGYGRSKLLAEQQLLAIPDLPLTILRPTAVYGPRERDLFIMIRMIGRGLEPYIGHKPQTFSFIHVTDLAEIAVAALSRPAAGIYNLSDGHTYDRYELARITKKVLGRRTFKFHVPLPVVKVIAGVMEKTAGRSTPALNREKLAELTAAGWQCSIGRAAKELGFRPQYNLESGLQQTIGWYREHKWF